ncbi:MAG: tetratricopeptide repeat protein [Myxococcales bacterium]|nr:tetratricopeptide repeat protein [Myxococcales bacterium]
MDHDDPDWDDAQEGAELLGEELVEEAIVELTRVLEENPRNAYAFFFLGNAHFEKEDWQRALKAYLTALEISPEYLGAMVGAGHALRMMGKSKEALRMVAQVLARNPNDADAFYLAGVTHFYRGEDAKAYEFLRRFLATDPDAEVRLEVVGMLEVLQGKILTPPDPDDVN